MKAIPLSVKLESCYEISNGCWVVTKYKGYRSGGQKQPDGMGYARIPHHGSKLFAHVEAYKLWVGEIPRGMEVDHSCYNKLCINPAHLEPVTPKENQARRRDRIR